MIKTKQTSPIRKILSDINKNWGVAVGFLLLLFLIPIAIVVNNTSQTYSTTLNADSSRPSVAILPINGKGNNQVFTIKVTDKNVDLIDNVQLWIGANSPIDNSSIGAYTTAYIQNTGIGAVPTWKSKVYSVASNDIDQLISYEDANTDISSQSSTAYSLKSNSGKVTLSTKDDGSAYGSVQFLNAQKVSSNEVDFSIKVSFKQKLWPSSTNVYLQASRGLLYGGASTSDNNNNIWINQGSWTIIPNASSYLMASAGSQPPVFKSVAVSSATAGNQYVFTIDATDPQGEPITYSITSSPVPSFLTLNNNVLSGTPQASDVGSYPISIKASDADGNNATLYWTLKVSPSASPTTIVTTTVSPTTPIVTSVVATTVNTNIQNPTLSTQAPLGVIYEKRPRISASLNAGSSSVDMTTLKVLLDNNDVTSKLELGASSFAYTPSSDLTLGDHQVQVTVSDKDASNGKGVLTDSWKFTVSDTQPGTGNTSTTSTTEKIKLPLLGIEVDKGIGTIIIGAVVILLFLILVIAIFLLIRLLRSKNDNDDLTQISKYYNNEPIPPVAPETTVPTNPSKLDTEKVAEPIPATTTTSSYPENKDLILDNVKPATDPFTTSQEYTIDNKTVPTRQNIDLPPMPRADLPDPTTLNKKK